MSRRRTPHRRDDAITDGLTRCTHATPPFVTWRNPDLLSGCRLVIFMYIDPGAGSMVIQAMLAAILAVPFFFRTQISRVVSRMRRMRSDSTEDASES